jgi:hypothetical protein
VAILIFAVFAALYATKQREIYSNLLMTWGIPAYQWPFLDTDTVLSAVRCLRAGVDAYAANPCDPLSRTFDYSPLWMALTALPVTTAWIPWVGMVFVACFFGGLALLPPGRTREATVLVVLGVISTPVVLAVERGNNDLVIFLLVACMASLLGGAPGRRLVGYALGVLAGLLKYYPLLVMAAALREKPGRFLAVAAASLAVTASFAMITWPNLSRALAIIPTGSPYYQMFGAKNLGLGIATLFGLPGWFSPVVRGLLTVAALGGGIALGLREDTRAAIARLDRREGDFLLIGALMAIGCFLSAQNIVYRSIDLLLVLPSLTALRIAGGPWRLRTAPLVVLGLLWHELYYRWMQVFAGNVRGTGPGGIGAMVIESGLGWLPRELGWWWLIALLVSCATALLKGGPQKSP